MHTWGGHLVLTGLGCSCSWTNCSTQASLAWERNKTPRNLLVLLQAEFLIYDPPFYTAEKKDVALTDPVGE